MAQRASRIDTGRNPRSFAGRLAWLAALLLASSACEPFDGGGDAPAEPALEGRTDVVRDVDRDWLEDAEELELANRYAPLVHLPLLLDWTLPASVEWYLPRVHMRMHHDNCSDCGIVDAGSVTQDALVSQAHRRRVLGWTGCSHEYPVQYSNGSWLEDDHPFLQQWNDAFHAGSSDPRDWIVYAHVYKNTLGGVDVQYWYFWSYNDGPSFQNHEGDWEGLEVRLDATGAVARVVLNQHNERKWYDPSQLEWYGGTHPVVWVSDGSHATFSSKSECDGAEWPSFETSCLTIDEFRWFTWEGGLPAGVRAIQGGGVMNLGEKEFPMPGATFIRYSGRWGEEGELDGTSGPRGPAYTSWWSEGLASCGGSCGGQAAAGCWCDEACAVHGDCCSDACQACGQCPSPQMLVSYGAERAFSTGAPMPASLQQ